MDAAAEQARAAREQKTDMLGAIRGTQDELLERMKEKGKDTESAA